MGLFGSKDIEIKKNLYQQIVSISRNELVTVEGVRNWKEIILAFVMIMQNNWHLIHLAAYSNNYKIMQDMLERGADPNSFDCNA